jgi:hypothetical protein
MAGYSGRSLADKLGIKEAHRVCTIGAPSDYKRLVSPLPAKVTCAAGRVKDPDLVHLFARRRSILTSELTRLRPAIPETTPVWVSWPKKASGVATDITEDVIREVALPMGFVDIKVCAVDEVWSGLKLVIRKSERARNA